MGIFPGIQASVNESLLKYKAKKPLLGVGSNLIVEVPNLNKYLLLAPTMDLPAKLKNSWNIFWAALGIFYLTRDMDVIVAIPGLGTGTGHIDPDDMLEMMQLAWGVSSKLSLHDVYSLVPNIELDYLKDHQLILNLSLHEQAAPRQLIL